MKKTYQDHIATTDLHMENKFYGDSKLTARKVSQRKKKLLARNAKLVNSDCIFNLKQLKRNYVSWTPSPARKAQLKTLATALCTAPIVVRDPDLSRANPNTKITHIN